MKRFSRKFLLAISIAIVFALIWQKLNIFVVIPISGWSALAIFAIFVVVLFLFLDHIFNKE